MKRKYVKVGRHIYSHSSVVGLIERHHGISQDPREIMQHLIRIRIDAARNLGWDGPPYDPRFLASTMGINSEKSKKLILSEDAELHPNSDGKLVIRYNPDKPRTRQNFSIAHEICHTFFPEYESQFHARHKIGEYDSHNELEFLCDFGASEIILPAPEFDSDVYKWGVSITSLERLSKRYEASMVATAIRAIGIARSPCALVVLDYTHKPVELSQIEVAKYQLDLFNDGPPGVPPAKLRVQFCVPSSRFSAFIPKHKSIDELSPLYEVSIIQEEFQGDICLDLKHQNWEFYVEAVPVPGTHNPDLGSRVLAILFQR